MKIKILIFLFAIFTCFAEEPAKIFINSPGVNATGGTLRVKIGESHEITRAYKAKVNRVHDGDTCSATIELGLDVSIEVSIRLRGINAPELKTGEPGAKSRDRLRQLISGKTVKLITHTNQEREKYGRVLAAIYLDDVCINDLMLKEGLAVPYMEKE